MNNNTISSNIKLASSFAAQGNYLEARKYLLATAESLAQLVKSSSGAKQKEYLAQYNDVKALLLSVNAKLSKKSAPKNSDDAVKTAPSDSAVNSARNTPTNKEAPVEDDNKKDKVRFNDSLTPQYLSDYIGQPDAVTAVKDLINAALLKNAAMPHLILYGSHGLGKTTFAKIIANELKANFIEINVSKINVQEIIAIFKKLKPRDVVFIDEIHILPLIVAESVLYSAMQDGKIVYNEGKGKFAHPVTLTLPPFTLIGATTEIGKLAKPFTQRAIQVRLVEYSDEVLSGIISKSFYKLGMSISPENALYIAKRCRNNPRIANNTVKRISDKALVRYAAQHNLKAAGSLNTTEAIRKLNIQITPNLIDEFFEENGIDEYGLENGDRELLRLVITRYNGGPVGLDNLARALNESNNVISQKYEAYLIKKGLYKVEREGRIVMPEAYKVLGLPLPDKLDVSNGANSDENNSKGSKYDKRTVIACLVQDEVKCEKIERLITYPSDAKIFEESLDELFPDIEQEYEADPKHRCQLEVSFENHKRLLSCDSFLESRFATTMAKVGFLQDIKAQTVELAYVSQELANRRYFPDFVVKDYKGRVAVIEMKNFEMMSYHLNIDKYFELKNFCASKGYGYAEVMKANNAETYVSVEDLINAPVNSQLEQHIINTIQQKTSDTEQGAFTVEDFNQYVASHGATPITDVFTILLNNRRLKNVDRVGGKMHIVLN